MDINLGWLVSAWFVFEIFVRIVALFVVPRNRKPTAATAWLLLILLFPTIGLISFLLIGSPKLSKRRQAQQRTMNKIIDSAIQEAVAMPETRQFVKFEVPERFQSLADLNTSFSGFPVFSGNKVELLPEYQNIFDSIVKDINNAQQFVHIEFFIIALDDTTKPLFKAIANATKRGVKVRVLFDAVSCRRYPKFKQMKQALSEAGAEWHPMLPLKLPGKDYTRPDLRNHRKLVVIDARVGYTGSLNLVQRNYHRKDQLYYDELMVRIQGPVVTQLHGVFVTDWYSESGELLTRETQPEIELSFQRAGDIMAQILPSGPGYENENNLKLFNSLMYQARKRIVITNPYFVPDESLLQAITSAAQRGVEVQMINSEIMDQKMVGHAQRSYYEQLLKAGVKIYWYDWPILLHAKFMTIDDDMAVIGSSNLDIRSFELDLEISLFLHDKQVVKKLHEIENGYLNKSKQVTITQWQKRSTLQRLWDNLARLTAALQ